MSKFRKLLIIGLAAFILPFAINHEVKASYIQDYPEASERVRKMLTTSSAGGWIGTEEELGIDNISNLINEVNTSYYDSIYLKNWIYYPDSGNVEFNYHLPADEINKIRKKLDKDVDKTLKEIIPKGASDFEKVLAIHDYIVMNTKYDKSWKDNRNPSVHTADGAFYNKAAICGGYANLMSLMLDKANIENNYVLGYLKNTGGYHAWNQVKVDDEWYYIDTTWDDPFNSKKDEVIYDYFLISEEDLKKTHTWDSERYPKTGNKYNYMRDMTNFNKNPLQIKRGYVYYSSKSNKEALYRIKLDGSEKERLTNDRAPYFAIVGNKAYFSNYSHSGKLYKVNIMGRKNFKNLQDVHVKDLRLNGKYLEYINVKSGKIEKMRVK